MGRPVGTTNRPQFHTYIGEVERKNFVLWVIKNYKRRPELARWFGDQMFGKAAQPLTGDGGGPLQVEISEVIAKKHGSKPRTGTDS